MDKMRKEFETWWKDFHNGREIDHAYVEEDNSYTIAYANAQWIAWQEAKKSVKQYEKTHVIPVGWILVPKEPTPEMIGAGVNNTPETPSQDYWHDSQPLTDEQAEVCYKAMIKAVEKNDERFN